MAWPLSQDYNEAIQNPRTSFSDAELRQGQVVTNALGLPQPCSGNFADVYAVECAASKSKWAVKCFTREVHGLRERYSAISNYLKQANLPFTVEFQYLEQGIRIAGKWYPILKMHWVEGFTLNAFVRDNLDKPALLEGLSRIWLRMAQRLREANLAHCDLQHGNVLLVPGNTAASLAVKLIDYDGMWVPALAQTPSGEIGHPAYQHPQRLRDGVYNREVDRFPLLAIHLALRALMVGGRPLWERFENGDNLLFRQQDFEAPARSPLFAELLRMNQPDVRDLAVNLIDAARKPLEQVPHLTELVHVEAAPPPPSPRRKTGVVQPVVSASAPVAQTAAAGSAWDFEGEDKARPRRRRMGGLLRRVGCSVAVGVAALGLAAAIFALAPWKEPEKPKDETRIAQKKHEKPPQRPDESPKKAASKEEEKPASKEEQPAGDPQPKDDPSSPPPPEPRGAGDSPTEKTAKTTDGFVPLFNGKDTTSWLTQPSWFGDWRVENGVLIWTRTDNSLLWTERNDFTDFHLRVEVRIRDKGYAQLIVRDIFQPPGGSHDGYRIVINSSNGNANKTGGLVAGFRRPVVNVSKPLVPPDEWFRLEVIAEGNHIVVKVNGQTTADYPDPERRFARGHITLFPVNEQIEFRKIEIKELRPTVEPGKQDDPVAHYSLGNALMQKGDLEGAIAAYRRALQLKEDYPQVYYNLGNVYLRLGQNDKSQLDEAIKAYRKAIELQGDFAEAHCNLGHALRRQGRFADALAALRRGDELGRKRPSWQYPSPQWVRDAERMAQLADLLPGVLKGEAPPSAPDDRLLLADICREHKRFYGRAARLAADAFTTKPSLAENLAAGNRYNAACAAALAGCGKGEDAGELDEKERAHWRQQALAWLRADFDLRRKQLSSADAKTTSEVHSKLRHWQKDPDLAGVRDEKELVGLPEAERQDWQKLWADVARVLEPVAKATSPEPPKPLEKPPEPVTSKPPEKPPEKPAVNPEPPPARAEGDLPAETKTAAKAFEKSREDARAKLLAGFDTALDKLAKSKGSTEQRLKLIDAVKEEKKRFESRSLIPWSEPMRPHRERYFAEMNAAANKLRRVYNPLIDAQLRAKNDSMVAKLRADLAEHLKAQPIDVKAPQGEDDFTSLSGEKDWKTWYVQRRISGSGDWDFGPVELHGSYKQRWAGDGPVLATNGKDFQDFQLRFEVKLDGSEVLFSFRDQPPWPTGNPAYPIEKAMGYGVLLADARRAMGKFAQQASGSLFAAQGIYEKELLSAASEDKWIKGEWNAVEVTAQGNALTVAVNDAKVGEYVDEEVRYRHGHFSFNPLPGCELFVRNIRIKELPPTAIKALTRPSLLAEEKDFTPLFNGKDFTGWKTFPDGSGAWKVDAGLLTGQGRQSYLFSERGDYENFHLRAEGRINKAGNSGLLFHALFGPGVPSGYEADILPIENKKGGGAGSLLEVDPAGKYTLLKESAENNLLAPNQWFAEEVIVEGEHIVIRVNGKTAADHKLPSGYRKRGHLALQQFGSGTMVEFRKIEIKLLDPGMPPPGAEGGLPLEAKTAAKAFEKSRQSIRAKSLAEFSAVLDRLAKSKGSTEQRLKLIDAVKEEKKRFESGGLIPWSEPMRPFVVNYFAMTSAAETKLRRAYNSVIDAQLRAKKESLVAELRTELNGLLQVRVTAKWRYFLNGRLIRTLVLYSNGRCDAVEGNATWTYAKGSLILRWPNPQAPGGAWIDTLTVSADGMTYSGTNNGPPDRRPKLFGAYVKDD